MTNLKPEMVSTGRENTVFFVKTTPTSGSRSLSPEFATMDEAMAFARESMSNAKTVEIFIKNGQKDRLLWQHNWTED